MRFLRPALPLFLLMSLLLGIIYPALVWGVAHALFPSQAEGSQLSRNGTIVGSALIGQNFTEDAYFWPRPSQTSVRPYNAQASGSLNWNPANPKLLEAVKARAFTLRAAGSNELLPVDSVTSSASGLDPHISPETALLQAARIAATRYIPVPQITKLIQTLTDPPTLGFLGEARVNVLLLNLRLDELNESGS